MLQTSGSVSRGRTQVAKPLASGLTAPTTSTRARARPRLSATAISAERRMSAGNKTAAEVAHSTSTGIEKRTKSIRQISTKPKSQLSEPHLSKGSSGNPATTEINQDSSAPAAASSDANNISELGDVNPSSDSLNALHAADALQVAAQTYPWLYMSSTLDACFTKAEQSVKRELDTPLNQVSQNEADFADEKALYQTQRLIGFCDELTFAKEAPAIMQSFMAFGEICERTEAESLQLAMAEPSLESEEPLQMYNAMMDRLDNLQEQASELESSILSLTESNITTPTPPVFVDTMIPSQVGTCSADNKKAEMEDINPAREQIMSVFMACLPVLRARKANLTMAQELIDSAQENLSLALRMKSMGID